MLLHQEQNSHLEISGNTFTLCFPVKNNYSGVLEVQRNLQDIQRVPPLFFGSNPDFMPAALYWNLSHFTTLWSVGKVVLCVCFFFFPPWIFCLHVACQFLCHVITSQCPLGLEPGFETALLTRKGHPFPLPGMLGNKEILKLPSIILAVNDQTNHHPCL